MNVQIPVEYADLVAFAEDYRSKLSSRQYMVADPGGLAVGDFVDLLVQVPAFGTQATVTGRVMAVMGEQAGLELQSGEEGLDQLEEFYRLTGRIVESLLRSGRFKVAGQWGADAAPQQVAAAPAPQASDTGSAPAVPHGTGTPTISEPLDKIALLRTLQRLGAEKAQGLLEITYEGQAKRRVAFVIRGGVAQWRSDPMILGECLGVMLARAGRLTEDQLERSLKMMNDTGRLQGECLVDLGVYTPPQIGVALATQVEIITRTVLAEEGGTVSFYPLTHHDRSFDTAPMRAVPFVYSQLRKHYREATPALIDERLTPVLDRYTRLDAEVGWDEMRLKTAERRLAEVLLKKSYRVREVFSVSTMSRGPTNATLLAWMDMGLLVFEDDEDLDQKVVRWRKLLVEKSNAIKDQHAFAILETHWTSQDAQIETAYQRLTKEYGEFGRGADLPPELDAMRNEILEAVERAYAQLKSKADRQALRKKHFEPQQHAFAADLMFKQAEMLVMQERWDEVIDDLERCMELMPSERQYRSFLGSVRAKLGR